MCGNAAPGTGERGHHQSSCWRGWHVCLHEGLQCAAAQRLTIGIKMTAYEPHGLIHFAGCYSPINEKRRVPTWMGIDLDEIVARPVSKKEDGHRDTFHHKRRDKVADLIQHRIK